MKKIQRYRVDFWSPYAFKDDLNGRFCEYRYYEELLSLVEWKGIATAPLDRNILLFWPVAKSPVVGIWDFDHWKMIVSGTRINPTHWTSLPSNPI